MNDAKREPALIIADWGTSNLRLYLVDKDATLISSKNSAEGLKTANNNFPFLLQTHIGTWLKQYGTLPIMISGMAGSRDGWSEVPYVECPASGLNLAHNLKSVEFFDHSNCWIVPGVSARAVSGNIDVMRGEETQTIGTIALIKKNKLPLPEIICLPGTHNKWVSIVDGKITHFTTTMTGEIFMLMREGSLLSKSISEQHLLDTEGFEKGLSISKKTGGLLHHLFTVRTNQLFEKNTLEQGTSYLSGILLGNEIQSIFTDNKTTILVGDNGLSSLYRQAMSYFKLPVDSVDVASATIAGALELAHAANIVDR